MESVVVTTTDEEGKVLDKQTVKCEIEPYSGKELNIEYQLPSDITKTQMTLNISSERDEKDTENNTVKTEYGYSNVCVNQTECVIKNNNTAEISAQISNTGFADAENVLIKVCNESIDGEVLYEENISALPVGRVYELNYTFPAERMVSSDKDALNAVYVAVETSSAESVYSDNDQKIVFESLNCRVNNIELQGGKAVVNVTKNSADKAVLVLAAYSDSGNLVEVQYKDISTSDDIEFTLKNADAVNACAFIWESIDGMNPIADKYDGR